MRAVSAHGRQGDADGDCVHRREGPAEDEGAGDQQEVPSSRGDASTDRARRHGSRRRRRRRRIAVRGRCAGRAAGEAGRERASSRAQNRQRGLASLRRGLAHLGPRGFHGARRVQAEDHTRETLRRRRRRVLRGGGGRVARRRERRRDDRRGEQPPAAGRDGSEAQQQAKGRTGRPGQLAGARDGEALPTAHRVGARGDRGAVHAPRARARGRGVRAAGAPGKFRVFGARRVAGGAGEETGRPGRRRGRNPVPRG